MLLWKEKTFWLSFQFDNSTWTSLYEYVIDKTYWNDDILRNIIRTKIPCGSIIYYVWITCILRKNIMVQSYTIVIVKKKEK